MSRTSCRVTAVLSLLVGLALLLGGCNGPQLLPRINAHPVSGISPLTVRFNAYDASAGPDRTITSFRWEFGDGSPAKYGAAVEHTYHLPSGEDHRVYAARLTITDDRGAQGSSTVQISVFRSLPEAEVLFRHMGAVRSLAFGPDSSLLASASDDGTTILWSTEDFSPQRTLTGHEYGVLAVSFSPDGAVIATGSWDNSIRLWHATTGSQFCRLTGHSREVYDLSFRPDGTVLASVAASTGYNIRLWRVATCEPLEERFVGHPHEVHAVAFSPDGVSLATGSRDRTVKIWDVSSQSVLRTLQGHTAAVWAVSYSPDGRLLASASADRTVRVWEAETGDLVQVLSRHDAAVRDVAFRDDGRTLASASEDGTVRLWDALSGRQLATLKEHTGWVYAVAFSPDGTYLASGGQDQRVFVWDISHIDWGSTRTP